MERIVRAADVAARAGIRCTRADVPDALVKAVASHAARRLRSLGFVAVDVDVRLPRPIALELRHRHLVLFARGATGRAVRWIWRLAAANPRGHLLVLFPPAHVPLQVRERAPAYGREAEGITIAEATCSRRSEGAARASAELIAAGELERAEALLSGVEAEAFLRGRDVPESTRLGLAQIRFWQGRFEEAERHVRSGHAASPECVGWCGLIAWARGDRVAMRESIDELASVRSDPNQVAGFWLKGVGLLLAASTGSTAQIVRDADAFLAASRQWPPECIEVGRAMAIEALLEAGKVADARRAADRSGAASPIGRGDRALVDTLLQWLRARCDSAERWPATDRLTAFMRRTGARGLRRWGHGRGGMNMLDGLTALLELVHDADDEHVALKRGCSWVREHAGAEAVGIVTSEGASVVVSDGLARADLEASGVRTMPGVTHERAVAEGPHAVVTAPMRYGGVTIGFAVIKGRSDAATTLAEAGAAFASACAPALRARLDALALSSAGQALAVEILGASPSMAALREAIARSAGTAFSVLIEGESGTGKELVARALHRLSARRDRRLCAINCAALTDDLVEAELFGYVRGAFTGAVGTRTGLFEEAHGGTLFLDEVSELSARGQAKLLRVLQEREIRRLGENAPRPIDVRVIAATNQPLADAVGRGRFREDLLFRLAVVRIRVPTLRDRIEDVPLLAHAFWRKLIGDTGKRVQMGADAVAALCRYQWPGNVRELQNVIAGLVVAAPTRGRIGARHVEEILTQSRVQADAGGQSLDAARQAIERRMVAAALARHGGRRTRAAVELGISRQGLTKAIKRLGLGGVA